MRRNHVRDGYGRRDKQARAWRKRQRKHTEAFLARQRRAEERYERSDAAG